MEEGTREAQVLVRSYSWCLRSLLRAAHWGFARAQTPLLLLGDATGQTPNVGTIVPQPWVYSYAYPENCMKARFVPWNWNGVIASVPTGNIQPVNPNSPIVGGLGQPPFAGVKLRPAKFLEGIDPNNPAAPGPNNYVVQGVSPQGRTAIFTNVQNAQLVYTALMNYPSNWDPTFRAAFVAYLASEIALPIWVNRDKEYGAKRRIEQIAIAKDKILQARAVSANEAGWNNSDFETDWMRFRHTGGRGYGGGWGLGGDGSAGYFFGGCDDCCGAGSTATY
jgi:hypothetical protein